MSASAKTSLTSMPKQASKSPSKETKLSSNESPNPTKAPFTMETKPSLSRQSNKSKDDPSSPVTVSSPVETKPKEKTKKVKKLETFEFSTPPAMVVNEPSMEESVKLEAPTIK